MRLAGCGKPILLMKSLSASGNKAASGCNTNSGVALNPPPDQGEVRLRFDTTVHYRFQRYRPLDSRGSWFVPQHVPRASNRMADCEASTAQRGSILARWRWRTALPYFGTLLIFALIFWRIPVGQVAAALEQASALKFFGVFLPYSAIYWIIDSACLTWVIRRFNEPLRLREILPIRASMYVLSLINTNLGQGGVA